MFLTCCRRMFEQGSDDSLRGRSARNAEKNEMIPPPRSCWVMTWNNTDTWAHSLAHAHIHTLHFCVFSGCRFSRGKCVCCKGGRYLKETFGNREKCHIIDY